MTASGATRNAAKPSGIWSASHRLMLADAAEAIGSAVRRRMLDGALLLAPIGVGYAER